MAKKFQRENHIFRFPSFKSVVEEAIRFLTESPVIQLPPPTSFIGGGVYALYYKGGSELYKQIGQRNRKVCQFPIYVGKVVPSGWRTARVRTSDSPGLYRRLNEHSRSIRDGSEIEVSDFKCRFMILENLEADLVVLVEAELIRKYKPVWNTVVDGPIKRHQNGMFYIPAGSGLNV
jgi:hypothetical protein